MVGITIIARAGSKRLKDKHFLEVYNKPIIQYLINRIIHEFEKEISDNHVSVSIATSNINSCEVFNNFKSSFISIFRGSNENIPKRLLQLAEENNLDFLIPIDGDDILCSKTGIRSIFNYLLDGKSYISTDGLPFGMNSFGFSKKFLKKSLFGYENMINETGWGYIFPEKNKEIINFNKCKNDNFMRYTLDYNEDFLFIKKIIEHFNEDINLIDHNEIVEFVNRNNLFEINVHLIDLYKKNFKKELNRDKFL